MSVILLVGRVGQAAYVKKVNLDVWWWGNEDYGNTGPEVPGMWWKPTETCGRVSDVMQGWPWSITRLLTLLLLMEGREMSWQTPTKFLARNKIPFSMMNFKGMTFSIMQMGHIFGSMLNYGVWNLYKCGRHQVEILFLDRCNWQSENCNNSPHTCWNNRNNTQNTRKWFIQKKTKWGNTLKHMLNKRMTKGKKRTHMYYARGGIQTKWIEGFGWEHKLPKTF